MTKIKKMVIYCVFFISLLPLIVIGFFFLIGIPKMREFYGEIINCEAIDTTNHQAQLVHVLPSTAKNINYMIMPHAVAIYVDFTISEKEFMDWCAQEKWLPKPITHKNTLSPILGNNDVSLNQGWFYEKTVERGDTHKVGASLKIYYDNSILRCYYRQLGGTGQFSGKGT